MAARESQSIQIALILTFILTVILAVTVGWLWTGWTDEVLKTKAANKERDDANRKYDISEHRTQVYRFMVEGPFPDSAGNLVTRARVDSRATDIEAEYGDPDALKTFKEIKKSLEDFDTDMTTYMHDVDAAEHSYRKLPDHLEAAIRRENNTYLSQLTDSNNNRQAKTAAEDRAKTSQAEYQNKVVQADKKLNDELTKYQKEREARDTQKRAQQKDYDAVVKKAENDAKVSEAEKDKLVKTIDQLNNVLAVRKAKDERRSKFFEVADGQITLVNSRRGTVWINLGSADGLRVLTNFGVYDFQEDGVMRNEEEVKATIEVTKVIDQHLSEARITDDELKNPILPGDQIHTPAWQAGTAVHFALVGFFDLDDDGESDRERVRNLIASTGGIIDAEVFPDGTKTGKITARTRYVVKADYEKLASSRGFHDLMQEIQAHDVEQIGLDSFLNYIGWKRETFWVSLGRDAEAKDFIKGLTDRERPPTVSNESFKQRTPLKTPGRGNNGAF